MNNDQNSTTRIHEIVSKGVSGTIILPLNPSVDAIAAATALYLGLTKMGKNITLACSSKPQSDLTVSDKIQTEFTSGGDNLVVSFPYSDGAIDKVDYNIQGNVFNLIVAPRQGFPKLNPNQVKFTYSGGLVDFIIIIDSPTLQNLGTIYTDNQQQFTGKDLINVDRHLTNAFFGTVNFVNKTASSISELVLSILQGLQTEIDRDIATNLYTGISSATNNFTSYSVNADTFEHIATLLRLGAIKKLSRKPEIKSNNSFNNDSFLQSIQMQQPQQIQQPQRPTVRQVQKQPQIINPQTTHNPEVQNVQAIETVETKSDETRSSQDWLKPKIFKGSGLV
ncbi:MAG: DHH family phosphoesterase [bacterium]|nr:DHH family phosphoesterase [bacterium]